MSTTPSYVVDFQPIVQAVIAVFASAIGILGSAVLYRLNRRFNLQISVDEEQRFDAALKKALTYGAVKAGNEIRAKGWDSAEVHSEIVATAMQQISTSFPDALSAVGLTANLDDPKNAQMLTTALERALPEAMAQAAASPATPPTTAPNPETQAGEGRPVATIHVVAGPATKG
jgi:hypothetical protein